MTARAYGDGTLVFDRDAIVRAALRAYIESFLARLDPLGRHRFKVSTVPYWTGNPQRGALDNRDGCGNYEVVAWTEAGVVGLAYELGWGPIEQLGLSVDAVTGGPDDVRAAVPGLPAELLPALEIAVSLLDVGPQYGEKSAGVGFWLHGGRVAGSMFDDPTANGADRLAAWGLLEDGQLPSLCRDADTRATVAELARTVAAPIHAIVDAVVARALTGPTELTTDELATLLPTPPAAARVLGAQRCLQKVGVTWPGSPEIPPEPRRRDPNPFLPPITTTIGPSRRGDRVFDRDTIVRVALRTYVEAVFVGVDPRSHPDIPPCTDPRWTGDLQRGAFYNGDGQGAYDVVAWTEAGVVGLAYEPGSGPIEQLDLPPSAVTRGPDDVRAALPELPPELESTFVLAAGMLDEGGVHGERLAGVGFWLHGDRVGGSLFNNRPFDGRRRLVAWGLLQEGRLQVVKSDFGSAVLNAAKRARATEPPLRAIVDAVVARAVTGPTELTTDELATLLPTPPDPSLLVGAQRMLQKVGIMWPGSPEIPEEPRPSGSPLLPQPR